MPQMTIQAKPRIVSGRKTNQMRAEGTVPAVVYGFEIQPTNVELSRSDFDRLYKNAGESTIIDLSVDGASHPVLIQDIQRDPLTGFAIHVDFRRINLSEKVEATIELEFVGAAPAVKELGGTLVHALDEVEVSALPAALVRSIEVDVSSLATFDDVIRVADIKVPEGIEILNEADETIVLVEAPRSEEELAGLDEAVQADVSAVEVLTEKKEEPADGEAKSEEKKA